jgi:hypothetical protein
MKTTLVKLTGEMNLHNFLMPAIMIVIALVTSGSALMRDQDLNSESLRDRKLNLLEKLEKGLSIGSDEIKSSFGSSLEINSDCCGFFSHDEIEQIRESVIRDLESIKHDIANLRNSDEFMKAMDEIRKGRDEIRFELEKMREEIRRTERRDSESENG